MKLFYENGYNKLGSYTKFSCSLIKGNLQQAKITISPFNPPLYYPLLLDERSD